MTTSFAWPQITYAAARQLLDAALAHAGDDGWRVAVAVTDPTGGMVAFGRSDDAAAPVGAIAIDKA